MSDEKEEIKKGEVVNSDNLSQADKSNNKVMALLSYVGILVLIPYFVEKNSEFVRFHVIQGINLFIFELIGGVCGFVPIIGSFVGWLIALGTFILSIIGIINVLNEEAKELPIISKYQFIKK